MSGQYDFDAVLERRGTGSLKWDKYRECPEVLPMWVADMDFRSAPEVIEALHARVEHGVFGYTVPYEEAVEAVVNYHARVHGWSIDPEWICWLPGLVQALNLAALCSGEEGDEVMTCTPVYPPFRFGPQWQGRKLVEVPLVDSGERWEFDFEAMEAAVTARTRSFYLCSPHNPVGRVLDRGEVERVAAFCLRHGLTLVSDEIHCDLVFAGEHTATAGLGAEVEAISMTLNSASKTYNLPGLACAQVIIADPGLRTKFRRVSRGLMTEVNALGYAGCAAAYNEGEPWRLALIDYLRGNYELLLRSVEERLQPLILRPMEATYLAWLDARQVPVEDPVAFFEEAGVGLSSGVDFGAPGFVRLNFGCPRSVLQEGIDRMAAALDTLRAG